MAFSPGPWKWVEIPDPTYEESEMELRDANGNAVITAGAEGEMGYITGTAWAKPEDARLIAAAPEMYDMIQRLMADQDWRTIDEANALLARIKG